MPSLLAHIVTWNSPSCTARCIEALLAQKGFVDGQIKIVLTDNASSNEVPEKLVKEFAGRLQIFRNNQNLGFCAAHNRGAQLFLNGPWDYFLIINPDLRLEKNALFQLMQALERRPEAGSACPKLYRADDNLEPIEPRTLDAAGIYMTPTLRHFDRGSGEIENGAYDEECFVFGGSGACLLMRRRFVEDMLFEAGSAEKVVERIYPQLAGDRELRAPLFDEAFFAYREDADLAWRAQLLGWKCIFVPSAVGYHKRVVLPERRKHLPAELNLYGVRNRFLLQLNNFSWQLWRAVVPGLIWRNMLVVLGAVFKERSSLPALRQVVMLGPRALRRRRLVFERRRERLRGRADGPSIGRWFNSRPWSEPLE